MVNEEYKKRLEKERKEVANTDIAELIGTIEDANTTSHQYAREFKKIYESVRKGLVLLAKQRKHKVISNEEAVNYAKELLARYVEE